MGVAGSQPSSCIPCASGAGCLGINESDEVRLSKGIDRGIRETRRNLANTPKILLLGAGESGKSTIIKQMRILNNVQFTEYERELFRVQVFYNLVGGMRSLLEAMKELAPLDELSAEPGSMDPSSPGGMSVNAGVGVKRPRPAFLVDPPTEPTEQAEEKEEGGGDGGGKGGGGGLLGSPGSERRKELDGASTLNTNPGSAHTSPAGPSAIRPLSSTTDGLSPSNLHPSSSSSPPPPPTQDPDTSTSTNNNPRTTSNENATPIALSRSPTRSPSLSLNIFHPGALTQRQHATLLNELHYVPDIRPGEPFPMEYEGLLRGLWWGWEGHIQPDDGGPEILQQESGVGQYLDRIQSETGIALPDNLTYFFASPQRLSEWFGDEYVPSDEDVLRCRGRTTGIQETVFTLGKSGLGQALRERRKAAEARRLGAYEGTHGHGGGGAHGTGGYGAHSAGYGGGVHMDETGTTGTVGGGGFGTGTGTTTTASGTTTTATTSGSGGGGGYGSGHGHGHSHGVYPPPSSSAPQQLNAPLRIPMGKTRLHLVDVGGQRSERRKWMHCFQDVTAVLFLVGLSGYSQGMLEDPSSNQMQDAMALWDGVCSSQWFRQTSLILFLNKKDLFAEKMAKFPIKNYFPDYEGGDTDVTAGMDYFKRRFLRLYAKSSARRTKPSPATSAANTSNPTTPKEKEKDKGKGKGSAGIAQRRAVYTHFTTATDTMQLRLVIVAVCDIILRDNLVAAHFL